VVRKQAYITIFSVLFLIGCVIVALFVKYLPPLNYLMVNIFPSEWTLACREYIHNTSYTQCSQIKECVNVCNWIGGLSLIGLCSLIMIILVLVQCTYSFLKAFKSEEVINKITHTLYSGRND
jgi:hypothetical protein